MTLHRLGTYTNQPPTLPGMCFCLQDQRDALLGRVFGLASLSRSSLPSALPAAPAGSVSALRGLAVVAEQLVGLLQRKAFLRESSAAALVELLGHLKTEDMQQVRWGRFDCVESQCFVAEELCWLVDCCCICWLCRYGSCCGRLQLQCSVADDLVSLRLNLCRGLPRQQAQ
jgi:hypothetical protein